MMMVMVVMVIMVMMVMVGVKTFARAAPNQPLYLTGGPQGLS
jgi:hypothetical protein